MLIVQNVSLYQGATALLKNVTFQVDKSDIVTIMGSSGSGKSSLFSWMVGALSPQFQASGELWLNERRVDALPTAQRQIGIGVAAAILGCHINLFAVLGVNPRFYARRFGHGFLAVLVRPAHWFYLISQPFTGAYFTQEQHLADTKIRFG